MTVTAYQSTSKIAEDPRAREQRLFIQITADLERHAGDAYITPGLANALHANTVLWNTVAADLSEEGNQFPDNLKASLISLAIWVNRHSAAVLSHEAKVQALVDINRCIIRGLASASALAMPLAQAEVASGAQVKA